MATHVRVPLFAALYFLLATTHANVPTVLSYQAYLMDESGAPINNAATVTVSIYNVDSGGSPLWTDTRLLTPEQGLVSIDLGGSAAPFPPGLFSNPLWLGIEVDSDGEMTPRRALTTAAFAFEADNALSLAGQGAAAYDQSGHVADMGNPHGVTAAGIGAASAADIASLQGQINAALATIASLQNTVSTLQTDLAAANATVALLQTDSAANATNIGLLQTDVAAVQGNSVLALDGILTLNATTAQFSGVDVQIVNGTGTTDGATNGVGNLIVGYNTNTTDPPICSLGEFDEQSACESGGGSWESVHKSGSHNVVVGDWHNYSRHSGLVVGFDNNITGKMSSVTAGRENTARGEVSTVSGGLFNDASGFGASVSGGVLNEAIAPRAAIAGGRSNVASGLESSILGGDSNEASGGTSTVSGGSRNTAAGRTAHVAGGGGITGNVAFGSHSTVLGGEGNIAGDPELANSLLGSSATVSGGAGNVASGIRAYVSGGLGNTASGTEASVSGGTLNEASGEYASVTGGNGNIAVGSSSSVSGGQDNRVYGDFAVVVGGRQNSAGLIDEPQVSEHGVIVGGENNGSTGDRSVVSGGQSRIANGTDDWVAGSLFEDE